MRPACRLHTFQRFLKVLPSPQGMVSKHTKGYAILVVVAESTGIREMQGSITVNITAYPLG